MCDFGDVPLLVVTDIENDPSRMLSFIDAQNEFNRTVYIIEEQTQILRMLDSCREISRYVYQYTTLFSQLEIIGKE